MKPELKQRIEQINAGTAPAGYKKTKVGIVPEEWEVIKAKKVFRNRSDKKHDGTLEVLSVTQDRGVIPRSQVDIDIKYDKESTSSYKRVYTGDFVISLRSFQGGIEYSEYNGIVSPAYTVIEAFTPICDHYYRAYFKSPTYIQRLNTAVYGIRDGKNISCEDFSQIYIPSPPLPEQQKIAEILTAQDAVIALMQKQIELLQKQKKALMQKLLSGELRVGDGEWITVKLGKLFSERSEQHCESLELLAITGKYGVIPRSQLDTKDNSSEDKSKYLKICKGDIGYNTMRMWQGVSAYSNYTGIVSPAYTILVPVEQIDALYFAYLFKTPKLISLFYRFSQGLVDDTRSLKYQNFKQIPVRFPKEKTEQRKIAEILSAQDNEIELLQLQLALEQQKKKALMQLLLTGKVRVKT